MIYSVRTFLEVNLEEVCNFPDIWPEKLNLDKLTYVEFDNHGPIDNKVENIDPWDIDDLVRMLARFVLRPELKDLPDPLSHMCDSNPLEFDEDRCAIALKRFWEERGAPTNPNVGDRLDMLTDEFITLACNLFPYHRNPLQFIPPKSLPKVIPDPTPETISNLRIMVQRYVKFIRSLPRVYSFPPFPNEAYGPCKYIIYGFIDYFTPNEIVEVFVSRTPAPVARNTYKAIVNHLLTLNMGLNFKNVLIFNPRHSCYSILDTTIVPERLLKLIKSRW